MKGSSIQGLCTDKKSGLCTLTKSSVYGRGFFKQITAWRYQRSGNWRCGKADKKFSLNIAGVKAVMVLVVAR